MSQDVKLPSGDRTELGHFLMLATDRQVAPDDSEFEAMLRRMGLRPQWLDAAAAFCPVGFQGAVWRVSFGSLLAFVGQSAQMSHPAGQSADYVVRVQPIHDHAPTDPVAASRELFKLAVLLVDLLSARKFYWSPADLWSDAIAFRAAVAEMLESGMPPILHLVAFNELGTELAIATCGLAYFCGQELYLESAVGLDRIGQMRRLARLAVDMSLNGRIAANRRFTGMVAGETIEVVPDAPSVGKVQQVRVRFIQR